MNTTISKSDKLLYTIAESCRLLGVCRHTLRKLVEQDKLHPLMIGDSPRFSRAELERFAGVTI